MLRRSIAIITIIIVVRSSEAVVVIVPANVPALPFAGVLIIAEVNPAKHARVGDIVGDGPEIGVVDDDARRIWVRVIE